MHSEQRRPRRRRTCATIGLAALLAVVIASLPAHGQTVADALATRLAQHDAARAIQREIDALAGKRESLAAAVDDQRLGEALALARAAVEDEKARGEQLTRSLEAKRDAGSGIVPMLEQMLDLLDQSIAADLPFATDERRLAVADARHALSDAAVSMADRYDAVIGVYRRELQFGYTTGERRAQIDIDGQARLVTLLRVGRIALYAISDDAAWCRVFALAERRWQPLGDADCGRLDAVRDDPTLAVASALPLSVPLP